MAEETPIQPPSLLDKLKIHKFKILGGVLGVLVFVAGNLQPHVLDF